MPPLHRKKEPKPDHILELLNAGALARVLPRGRLTAFGQQDVRYHPAGGLLSKFMTPLVMLVGV